jgi:hypothetical protein
MAYITIPSGTSIPTSLYDGNTVAWYDYNASTATMSIFDASTTVSRWNDQLGSGRDLIQNTSTARPTWSADGVLFDGVDDYIRAVAFTYNQPEMIYAVIKQVTWTLNDRILDGNTNGAGELRQTASTPGIRILAPTAMTSNSGLAINTLGIVRMLINSTASKCIVNNTTPITGDAGTNNMGGFTLGANGGMGSCSNIQVKEIILRNVAESMITEANIYNYLSNKYLGTNLGTKIVTFNNKYVTVKPYGPELNPDPYFSNTDLWSKGTGWTISGGIATKAEGSVANMNLISPPASANIVGRKYLVTLTIVSGVHYRVYIDANGYADSYPVGTTSRHITCTNAGEYYGFRQSAALAVSYYSIKMLLI